MRFVTFVNLWTMRVMEKLGWGWRWGWASRRRSGSGARNHPFLISAQCEAQLWDTKGQAYPQAGKGKFRSCESQAGISVLVGAGGGGGGGRRECWRRLKGRPGSSKAGVMHFPVQQHHGWVEDGTAAASAACYSFPRSPLGLQQQIRLPLGNL